MDLREKHELVKTVAALPQNERAQFWNAVGRNLTATARADAYPGQVENPGSLLAAFNEMVHIVTGQVAGLLRPGAGLRPDFDVVEDLYDIAGRADLGASLDWALRNAF